MGYNEFMSRFVILILSLAMSFSILSCESKPKTIGLEDYGENSQAHGAAFRADAMTIRRPMPSHADWKPLQFYFKHCTEIGEGSYYSKTSYECTGPW